MWIIEISQTGKTWNAIGISKVNDLDIIRGLFPSLKPYGVRLRAFVRVPGVYYEGEELGLIPVIDESGNIIGRE